MAKLLINNQNKVLVGSNGKAYAVGNMDAQKCSFSPVDFTAAAGRVLKLLRYGKCEQSGTPTPSVPVDIYCNNGALKVVDAELPIGYRRIVGITFGGNTYYDTGEKLYGSDVVTITIADFVSSGQNLFGCYSGTGSDDINFSMYIYGTSTGQSYWRYGQTLYRPVVGGTTERTISFGAGGTTGFKTDVTYSAVEFETTSAARIGALPNSSSSKYDGTIKGNITVGTRLKYIPCIRILDGAIGYYETVNGVFLEPQGTVPVAGAYDNSHLVCEVVGTPEVLTLGAGTATPQSVSVANLLAVGDYVDEQDIITGKVTRRCAACIYDGSQTIGDVFLSNTGGKDNGAIIVYPLATPITENVTPQPLNTGAGTNTLTDTAEVSNPELYIIHKI